MFDIICLWIGRAVVLLIAVFCAWVLFHLLKPVYYQTIYPVWLLFKHLLPPWQETEKEIKSWEEIIARADEDDWRSKVRLTRKGNFLIFHSDHLLGPFKIEFMYIKKK